MSTETSKFQIETGVDPSGVQDGMQAVEQAVIKTERAVTESSARTGKAVGAIGDHAAKGADKADKSLGNLTASIQRYNAQLEAGGQKGAKFFEYLADSRGLDKTNEAFQAAIAKTRQLESENQKLSISATQTAAAMRGVPAQITDIVTSLQGGQAPLTVLLQQGGQLKDMFGGTGNAARALGGYIMGLVNPLTVTAAGAATLAYALYAGGKESREFAQTLLVTGNQAGVTTGQLMAMAAAVSAVSGTQGNAADVLNQLAATGKVTSANLQQAAQAAVQFEKAGGQAAGETVKAFAELGKAPLEASLKLNESMGYLTKSTYAQIQALMDQGRETEAASVAQKAFADALSNRSGEMVKNLGLVERGWSDIKGAVTGAWDAIKSIGRDTGVEGQASAASATIKNLEAQIALRGASTEDTLYNRKTRAMRAELDALRERQSVLQSDERLLRAAAGLQAEQVRLTKATAEWDKEGEKYLSKQAQMQRDITKARGEGLAAQRSQADIDARIAAIREKYKESGTGQDAGEAALAKQKATLEEAKQYAINLQRELAAVMAGDASGFAKQTQAEKTAIELQAQLATGIKGVARANMEKQLAVALDTVEVEKSNRVTEKQIQIQQDLEKQRTAELKALGADAVAIQAKADTLNAELGVRGKSKAAIEEGVLARLKENAADVAMFDNSGDVVAAINAKAKAQEDYVKALKATDYKVFNEHTDELLRSAQEQQKLYQDELQLSGLTAVERAKIVAQRAIELKYAKELDALNKSSLSDDQKETQRLKLHEAKRTESAAASSKAIQAEYDRVSQQIEQSLTDALMRGFESGKGFAEVLRDTVANMFKTLVLRPIVSAIVNPVAGAITGGLGLAGTANAATSAGNLMGAGAGLYNSFATSSVGGSLGLSVPYVDVLGTGAAEAGIMTSAGSSLGAALPWIGGGLAVLSLLKSLDDSGTYHTGGLGSYSAAGGTAVGDAVKTQGLGFDLAAKDYTASSQQAAAALAQSVVGMLDSTANTFGQQAGYYAATAFADDTSKDGAWGALMLKLGDKVLIDWQQGADKWPGREFADGEAGAKEYAAAIAIAVRDQLITQVPDWADATLQALGDAPTLDQLGTVVTQINAAAAAMAGMGQASAAFAGLSESATAALIKALGGADASAASLGSYYTNFYSESERAAIATAQLTDQLAALGVAMPTGRDAYKALVDAAVAAGDATLAAQLISLGSAFSALVPAAADAATAAKAAAQASTSALKTAVDREKQGWQTAVDAAAALRTEVQGVFDLLGSSIKDLRTSAIGPALSAAQGQQFISTAAAAATQTGAMPDQALLADAISAATGGMGLENFASVADQQFAQLALAGQLESLQGVAGVQLSTAEQMLTNAESQLNRLDDTLEYWQQQVDLSQGGIDATVTVEQAVRDLIETIKDPTGAGKKKDEQIRTGGTPGYGGSASRTSLDGVPDYAKGDYVKVGNRYISTNAQDVADSGDFFAARLTKAYLSPEADMLSTWQQLTQSNFAGSAEVLLAEAAAAGVDPNILASYRAEFLPKLAVGTNYIPKDGPYYLHQGEAVQPVAYNPALGGQQADPQLRAEMAAQRQELAGLRSLMADMVRHSRRTADAINGNPEMPMLVTSV